MTGHRFDAQTLEMQGMTGNEDHDLRLVKAVTSLRETSSALVS